MEKLENTLPRNQSKALISIRGIREKALSVQDAWLVLVMSICAILPAWINYDIISRDGAHLYIPVAKMFLNGEFHEAIFSPLRPLFLPLYEFLVFLMAKLTGLGLETSGRLVSAISFLFAAAGLYRVAHILFQNRIISFLSVLLLIANRELLKCSVDCLKESLLVALVIWGNYFILRGISSEKRTRFFFIGCTLFIAGGLVRSTSLIFLAAWGMVWVFHKKTGILIRLLGFLTPIVSIFVLYHLFNHSHWGLLFFRRSYGLSRLTRIDLDVMTLMNYSLNMIRQFLAKWYYIIAIFGFAGVYRLRKETYSILFMLLFIMSFLACSLTGFFFIDRYIIVPVIAIYPLAAYAIFHSIRSGKTHVRVVSALTIFFCIFLWAGKAFTPPDAGKLARKEAGMWILSQMGPEEKVLTNRQRIGFYADTTSFVLSKFESLEKKNQIIARKTPYWKKETVRISQLKGKKGLNMAVALDMNQESPETKILAEKLAHWNLKPDKTFGNIQVYLPGS